MTKNTTATIQNLLDFFAGYCTERTTLDELRQLLPEHDHWQKAHDLFQRIRRKTLDATKQENRLLEAQYLFEEVCAKTIYNLSRHDAPFDPDSPYRIVPNAFALARRLRVDDREIVQIIAPRITETQT